MTATADDATTERAPGQPAADDAGPLLQRPRDLRARAGQDLRGDVVLRRTQHRPRRGGPVPHRPGRPRVDPHRARAPTAACARFFNVCRHRGARLCPKPDGQVRRSIQCAYHAWTYGLDGRLDRGAQPHLDARHRPDRLRPGAGPPAGVARATPGSAWPTSRRRSRTRSSRRAPSGSATRTLIDALRHRRRSRSAGGSATTWPPTGSSSSRTSWSATTARRSTRSSPRCCRSSRTASRRSTTSVTARRSATDIKGFTVDGSEGFDADRRRQRRSRTASTTRSRCARRSSST